MNKVNNKNSMRKTGRQVLPSQGVLDFFVFTPPGALDFGSGLLKQFYAYNKNGFRAKNP